MARSIFSVFLIGYLAYVIATNNNTSPDNNQSQTEEIKVFENSSTTALINTAQSTPPTPPTGSKSSKSSKEESFVTESPIQIGIVDEGTIPSPLIIGIVDQSDPDFALVDNINNEEDTDHEEPEEYNFNLNDGDYIKKELFLDNTTTSSTDNFIETAGTGNYHQIPQHGQGYSYGGHKSVYVEKSPPNLNKPLKDSVVHRNPYHNYDVDDFIRTQDEDSAHHSGHTGHPHTGHPHTGHPHTGHPNTGPTSEGYTKYQSGENSHAGTFNQLIGHVHKTLDTVHHHPQPKHDYHHFSSHKAPECAYKNRYFYNLTFCLEDHYYPTDTISYALQNAGPNAQKLFSDVTYQSADNLVSGLTRAEEEGYTYKHYFGGSYEQHNHLSKYKPPYSGYSYSHDYYKRGGYICPSDIYYARPLRAMNSYGKWKIIVNLDYHPKYSHYHPKYTQTLRLEQCIYPNSPCSYIDSHVYSRCLQKNNFVRLVAWDYEDGIHVDTFKMPIACSCHINELKHVFTTHHHHEKPILHHHPHQQPPPSHQSHFSY